MAFWSSETLRKRLGPGLIIDPYDRDPKRTECGVYELALGEEVFVTSQESKKKQTLKKGEQLIIPPGQFGVLTTEERVSVPRDSLALISMKFGIKSRGLINVSGFHVDPGFSGQLKFSVYNAGRENVVLQCGQRTFLIWFCKFDEDIKAGDLYTDSWIIFPTRWAWTDYMDERRFVQFFCLPKLSHQILSIS